MEIVIIICSHEGHFQLKIVEKIELKSQWFISTNQAL